MVKYISYDIYVYNNVYNKVRFRSQEYLSENRQGKLSSVCWEKILWN